MFRDEGRASLPMNVLTQMATTKSERGGFFTISPEAWATACDTNNMNTAVAYLVLAQGTARNNRTTGWSVESLHKYAGITRERGQAAVTHLINSGLLRHGANHIRAKPRYELTSPGELAAERYRASLAAISDEDRVMMN
jgi:hypothetical protein